MKERYAFRMLVCSTTSSVPSTGLLRDSNILLSKGSINSSKNPWIFGFHISRIHEAANLEFMDQLAKEWQEINQLSRGALSE